MKRETLVFFVGLALVVVPFAGIPGVWKQWAYVGCGVLLALVGYQLRRQAYLRSLEVADGSERRAEAYVESATFSKTEPVPGVERHEPAAVSAPAPVSPATRSTPVPSGSDAPEPPSDAVGAPEAPQTPVRQSRRRSSRRPARITAQG